MLAFNSLRAEAAGAAGFGSRGAGASPRPGRPHRCVPSLPLPARCWALVWESFLANVGADLGQESLKSWRPSSGHLCRFLNIVCETWRRAPVPRPRLEVAAARAARGPAEDGEPCWLHWLPVRRPAALGAGGGHRWAPQAARPRQPPVVAGGRLGGKGRAFVWACGAGHPDRARALPAPHPEEDGFVVRTAFRCWYFTVAHIRIAQSLVFSTNCGS